MGRAELVHDHTTGTLGAYEADKQITRILTEGGHLLNVEVLDYLIILEDGDYISRTGVDGKC